MAQAREVLHFTRSGVLMHAVYEWTQTKNGEHWEKDARTEAVCICAEREDDRKALIGINQMELSTMLKSMLDQTPVYVKT